MMEKTYNDFINLNIRLRISITKNCNLQCTFCHAEGLDEYIEKNQMDYKTFCDTLASYNAIGGKEINITGGEPLLHPKFLLFLKELSIYQNQHITLSTNGLLLHKFNLNPEIHKIDETKISVHTFNATRSKTLLGKNYNVEQVKTNIKKHVEKGFRTIINFTLTSENKKELASIIEWVLENDINMKINDLGKTNHNVSFFEKNYEDPFYVQDLLEKYSIKKNILGGSRSGNILLQYILPNGKHILLKDEHQGKLETNMCKDCHKKKFCSEGVFALRVNPNGDYQPCLLRREFNIKNNTKLSKEKLLYNAIDMMINGI